MQVRDVLTPIGEAAPELGRFVDAAIDRAVEDHLLLDGSSGIILP